MLYTPDSASEWMVLCSNPDCLASNEGRISVLKINWLIRCSCCGRAYDSFYFQNQLKKAGVFVG